MGVNYLLSCLSFHLAFASWRMAPRSLCLHRGILRHVGGPSWSIIHFNIVPKASPLSKVRPLFFHVSVILQCMLWGWCNIWSSIISIRGRVWWAAWQWGIVTYKFFITWKGMGHVGWSWHTWCPTILIMPSNMLLKWGSFNVPWWHVDNAFKGNSM